MKGKIQDSEKNMALCPSQITHDLVWALS